MMSFALMAGSFGMDKLVCVAIVLSISLGCSEDEDQVAPVHIDPASVWLSPGYSRTVYVAEGFGKDFLRADAALLPAG